MGPSLPADESHPVALTAQATDGEAARRSMRLLITGATGFIGRHVVAHAVDRGHRLTALVRDPARSGFPSRFVNMVRGDINDSNALRAAASGAEVAIHLVAATRTADPVLCQLVNVEGTRSLIAACRGEGVRRIIALSTLSVHHRVVGSYGTSKREMERLLLECGLETVVLRPGLVFGPSETGVFHRMTRLIEMLPVTPIIGSGAHPVWPVHVSDVVEAILQCLCAPHVVGRCYDIVGPESLPFREFVARVGGTLGQTKRQVHIPTTLAWLAARAMARVIRDPPITVDNVIGASQAPPCDPGPARRDLSLGTIPLGEGLSTIRDPTPQPGERLDRPLRIVIVGLGKMGVTHTALFSMIPGARVAAVVDQDPRLAATIRGMGFRVPFFASLPEALAETRPDGIVIATPTHTHASIGQLAASHGVGVLIEKPLAENLESAMRVAASLMEKRVPALCGYTLAYLPTFEKLKALLDSAALGRVQHFESSMFLSEVFGPKSGWRYDAARAGGGVLPNLASHLLFLLHWFFGEADRVEAKTESLFTELDDAAHVRLMFAGGIEGTLETSWSREGFPLSRTEITIDGENGRIVCNDEMISVTLHTPASGLPKGETRIHTAELPQEALFDLGGEAYFKEDADFVEAVRTGRPARASINRALHVQAMLEAIYRSASSGGAGVPLRPTSLVAQKVIAR